MQGKVKFCVDWAHWEHSKKRLEIPSLDLESGWKFYAFFNIESHNFSTFRP